MEYSHEIIMPNDDIPFKMFIFEGKDGKYVRGKHWHNSIEIFALLQGELEFYVNEAKHPLRPGEFMLVNSNEIHSINAQKSNFTVVLQIPLETFKKYYTDERFIYFSHSRRLQDEEVMRVIQNMYEIYIDRSFGYELKVQSHFYHLLYLLVSKYREVNVNEEMIKNTKKLNKLSKITAYMKENYNGDISLESLAKTFGYSSTYLSRMFQKYAKMNYKAYLDNLRLEYAYKALVNTDLSISTIASDNGFPNSKAFTKMFRKKYDKLPSEFRKELSK